MCKAFFFTIVLLAILLSPGMHLIALEGSDQLIYATEDFAPYNYMEDGQLKGLSVDVLKIIWRELGVRPQPINVFPWARAYKMLKEGKNVVLFSTAKTDDRLKLFKWVCPISANTRTVLISLAKNRSDMRSPEKIKKCRIGVVRGDAAEQILLSSGFSSDQMDPVSSLVQNIRKLNKGRIDLIAFNEYSFFKILKTEGLNKENYETVYIARETIPCYAFSRDVPDRVVQRFQDALDKIRQGTEYKKLMEQYFP